MYPASDPWPTEPTEPIGATDPIYGRASVPVPASPLREPTAEMPAVRVPEPPVQAPPVSWQKVKKSSRRNLSDGWGFTAAGLIAVFCGLGLWAAAGRGSGTSPWPGLLLVLVSATATFVFARFLGYLVL